MTADIAAAVQPLHDAVERGEYRLETDPVAHFVPVREDERDVGELLAELSAAQPVDDDGSPRPILAGTVALYPDGKGGVVIVMDVREGVMPPGVQRVGIPSGMVRALVTLAGTRGRLARLTGRRRAKSG